MPYEIDFSLASSEQIEVALCKRVEKIRLLRNITRSELASRAGVSLKTLSRLEKGEGTTLDTFIRVMSALGIQSNLATLLPDPSIRPMERIRHSGMERQRARPEKKRGSDSTWTWGDETEKQP